MTAVLDTPAASTPSPPESSRGRRRPPRPTRIAGMAIRMPFWVLTAALAIIFLYPLVWTAIASVAPLAGTNQTEGWGLGNYITLANYQDGIVRYIGNSVFVSVLTVVLTLGISLLGLTNTLFGSATAPLLIAAATEHLYHDPKAVGWGISTVSLPALVIGSSLVLVALFALRRSITRNTSLHAVLAHENDPPA